MSFSFRVQASTKDELKRLVAEQLSEKSVARKGAIAACNAYIDMLDDDETKDYVLSASGSVGTVVADKTNKTTNAHLSLSAVTTDR